MDNNEKITKLETFKAKIREWSRLYDKSEMEDSVRTYINQNKTWVRREVIEAGCYQTLTISPPPAVGGLIMRNLDPFTVIFEAPYGMDVVPMVADMVDQTIGVLLSPPVRNEVGDEAIVRINIQENYAFIAMAIDPSNPELEDVLDAIKEGAQRCGVQAERVDEPQSNERITDRILESIKRAEFVIVDLTFSKPNVFYEAGYAHGIGKIPIYIAKDGTKLEFDLKDYPVIFYRSMKQLKDSLEKRIRGLAKGREQT